MLSLCLHLKEFSYTYEGYAYIRSANLKLWQ